MMTDAVIILQDERCDPPATAPHCQLFATPMLLQFELLSGKRNAYLEVQRGALTMHFVLSCLRIVGLACLIYPQTVYRY